MEQETFGMELDAKLQVLMAIYTEYQKDLPRIGDITPRSLGMNPRVFAMAVKKLQNEELIRGAHMHTPNNTPCPDGLSLLMALMTREGIEFVESKMDVPRGDAAKQKVELLQRRFRELGWDALAAFAGNVLAAMAQQLI